MIELWYQALNAAIGIEIQCSDAEKVRQRLYIARKEAKDADLDKIGVCISPFDPTKVWLVKKEIARNLLVAEPPDET